MGKQSTPRALDAHEAIAKGVRIRTSPRKLNLVAGLIRGKSVDQALAVLKFCKRRVSEEVAKVLMSAIANAENNHGLDIDTLYVSEASVGKALVMKRFMPRARGRAGRIEKPFSNIRIIVRERGEIA